MALTRNFRRLKREMNSRRASRSGTSAHRKPRGDAGLLAAKALEHRRLALGATVAGK
jgi:hypothetical protein